MPDTWSEGPRPEDASGVIGNCQPFEPQQPADAAKDDVPKTKLYDRLGGAKGIAKVVDDLFVIVVKHPKIRTVHKKHFAEGDVAGLKKKLRDQIGAATGGP